MNKNTRRAVAFLLLAALVIWLIARLGTGFWSDEKVPERSPVTSNTIEPKFTKEGELYLLHAHRPDTLVALDIELAERPDEIQYGMMYRRSIPPKSGMLFLMPTEAQQSFYMKNTYVPLDIIYINDSLKVVSIQKNAEPLQEKSLPSKGPASKVLEVKGGFSDQYGIKPGTRVRWHRGSS